MSGGNNWKEAQKNIWNLSKKKQNLHTMTINFLKYTITIYPLHNDSLVKKKMKEEKFSGNQKLKKKKNTVILSGTTNNQLD